MRPGIQARSAPITNLESKIGTATNKMDNFQTVSATDLGLAPAVSRNNFEIVLHSHPIAGKFEQTQQGDQRQAFGNLFLFTVHLNGDQNSLRARSRWPEGRAA